MKLRFAAGPSLALAVFAAPAVTQTRPATQAAMRPAAADASDAADLYRRAMAATPAGGPTNGLVFYSTAPPYPPAWHRLADAAYKANAATLALVRAARGIDRVVWPAPPDPQLPVLSRLEWLNQWVAVANEVQDAALVEHLRGDDAAAVGRVIDLLHMSDLLDGAPQSYRHVAASVGANITAKAMNRLLVITSSATLSDDPARRPRAAGQNRRGPDRQPARPARPDSARRRSRTASYARHAGAGAASTSAAPTPSAPSPR